MRHPNPKNVTTAPGVGQSSSVATHKGSLYQSWYTVAGIDMPTTGWRLMSDCFCYDLYFVFELWWLCGGKRGDYQNCSVLYCVLKLHTVISTLRWAVLTVLWIGFCLTGPISLCVDWFVFICLYFVFFFILHIWHIIVTRWNGPDGIGILFLKTLSYFSVLTLLVGSFDP